MEALAALADAQQARVEKLITREASLPPGILIGDVKYEARLLKDMLAELGRLQLETGVLPAGTAADHRLAPARGRGAEFAWTQEQEALFRTLETTYTVLDDDRA